MGAKNSVNNKALPMITKENDDDKIIALCGNPNVGKSTIFNSFTGMNQHTGNWSGKTVACTYGKIQNVDSNYILVDLPGTYSLFSNSEEEEIARNFLCFSDKDAVLVVCDATCLERNLNLALQIMEFNENVVICINLIDEAKRKKIKIDLKEIERRLNVPVIGICAHDKAQLEKVLLTLENLFEEKRCHFSDFVVKYDERIEFAISEISDYLSDKVSKKCLCRSISLKLLENDPQFLQSLFENGVITYDDELSEKVEKARDYLHSSGIESNLLKDLTVSAFIKKAEEICLDTVFTSGTTKNSFDRKVDKILTGRKTAYPLMFLMLLAVFWITIAGANYPSEMLSLFFAKTEEMLNSFLIYIQIPDALRMCLVSGVWRVLTWVVSVMLPPMAIFFPLFAILEDAGYLPRVAYNLDKPFRKCNACGKQALTMCMGFGCNAVGVTGARIIDSPRERYLAILTNNFVPCNGRFPTIIALISIFITGTSAGFFNSLYSALLLTLVILIGFGATFFTTYILSKTILKGKPSSFALELPPYRKPQFTKVIARSVTDRIIFVLARAIISAAPAGLIIWLFANVSIGDASILSHVSSFLDIPGRIMGLDGVILMAFILGLPANEIVVPIMLMAYLSQGSLNTLPDFLTLKSILVANNWTIVTAINTIIFSLMHWPCATTLMTIKKETRSIKWTLLAIFIPTVLGIILCATVSAVAKLFT